MAVYIDPVAIIQEHFISDEWTQYDNYLINQPEDSKIFKCFTELNDEVFNNTDQCLYSYKHNHNDTEIFKKTTKITGNFFSNAWKQLLENGDWKDFNYMKCINKN